MDFRANNLVTSATAYPFASVTISSILLLLVSLLLRPLLRTPKPLPFPPGPKGKPIIGNLHQIPLKKPFLAFTQWAKDYKAPVMGLRFGSQPVVVLNTWRAVRDLFDQRGTIYSSRPHNPIVEYVVPGHLHVAFMPYGRSWRRVRAAMVSFLRDEELEKVLPIQQAESTQLVFETLQKPSELNEHIMRSFCGVILESVYGLRGTRDLTDRFFKNQDEWAELLDLGAAPPLDIFPWFKYVPSMLTPWPGWRKRVAVLAKAQRGFYKEMFERGMKAVREGKAKESFLNRLVKRQESQGFSDMEMIYIAGVLIEAGADTTAMSMMVFTLAMAAYPDVQKRAQKEVDAVFGERLPNDIDPSRLLYLQGVMWEVFRWRPGFPFGIPHATTQDDVYEGQLIPAGTTVIANAWAINHNEEDYPNPDVFDPARWLVEDASAVLPGYSLDSLFVSTNDDSRRRSYAFGAGRRVCAGQQMAEKSLLLSMAKLLWAFDMRPEAGSTLDTTVETGFRDALLTGPKDAKLDFVVRSEARAAIIREEWKNASAVLSRFG